MVETRPIPWKAPKIGKKGRLPLHLQPKDYQKWKRWSGQIQMLLMAGAPRVPYDGPVDVDILFVLAPRGSPPDRMNLAKSLEDLVQGIAIVNDRQVIGGDVRRAWIGTPMTEDRSWTGPERFHLRVISRA